MENRSLIKPAIMVLGVLIISTTSCVVVRQGEFGVKRKLGKYEDKVYTSGMRTFNPFTSTFVKISGQTKTSKYPSTSRPGKG